MDFGLARQPSIFTLTMEEFQKSLTGTKDFGSMNMDELLRSIGTAEEAQAHAQTMALQRQPSLTLPRTLSQKTVDEVWRDLFKANPNSDQKDHSVERQPTLGEMTLDEFLFRAGLERPAINESSQPFGETPTNQVMMGGVTVAMPGMRFYGEEEEEMGGGERVEMGVRGRRRGGGGLERVVERRQKRMIKNRESAARSRARKQAYTMELEAEIVKLKEQNAQLQKKQAEFLMKQKNQACEKINKPRGQKKQYLRRTLTGPW